MVCVGEGGQTAQANSLLSPCGSWGWSLGCQVVGSFYPLGCLLRPRFSKFSTLPALCIELVPVVQQSRIVMGTS